MARQRSPDRTKAEELYIKSNGELKLKDIAKELNRPTGTVRGWKNKDKWDNKLSGTFRKNNNKNTERSKKKKNKKPKHVEVAEELEVKSDELTEKQRLFCFYYVKSFNATMAAIKAGYAKESAHVQGSRLLSNDKIKQELRRLKGRMTDELFIDAMDVLRKYIAIAFADVSDFVEFGNREAPLLNAEGRPVINDNGEEETITVSYVHIKDSNMVDGTILTEVSKGKDGIKVKLADKMKALEKLEQYFDLIPDKFKRKVQEEKLKIQKEKLEIEKTKAQTTSETENEVADMLRGIIDDLN